MCERAKPTNQRIPNKVTTSVPTIPIATGMMVKTVDTMLDNKSVTDPWTVVFIV
jgi:hypothetical protein